MSMKNIREIIQEEIINFLNESEEDNRTINDEFEVSSLGLRKMEKILEKVNKNLKTRNKTQLEIKILKTEERVFIRHNPFALSDVKIPYEAYTIKIIGDIPEIHDYEFIAKIEHTIAGNIINMNPSVPKENLPPEYRTFDQKCDICGTKRERNNTFILKKLETAELMVAGSTCLKKFLPLDDVKAMLNLGIQLETLRASAMEFELSGGASEEEIFGKYEGGGGGKQTYYYYHEDLLYFIWLAYLENKKFFISKSKAEQTGQNATIYDAIYLQDVTYNNIRVEPSERKRVEEVNKKYGAEAKRSTEKMMLWIKKFDWDQAMVENPNFADYYSNLKVINNLPGMEYKHVGYFSSLVPFYLKDTQPKPTINKDMKKESDYPETDREAS